MNVDFKQKLKKELVVFFIVTYVFSWGVFALAFKLGLDKSPFVILGVWGPSLMGVLITFIFYGSSGLKRFFARFTQFKKGAVWILPLLIGFLIIGFSGRFLWSLISATEFNLEFYGWSWVATVLISQFIIAGLGEEFGWRGFGLQRLQQIYSPLKSSFIIAFFHLFWHAPTYWLGQGMHNVPAIWAILFLTPWTILFTWAYNKSDGSIMVSVLFHSIMGATLTFCAFLPSESIVPITPDLITKMWLGNGIMGAYVSVVAIYWVLALLVISGRLGGFGKAPEFEHSSKE